MPGGGGAGGWPSRLASTKLPRGTGDVVVPFAVTLQHAGLRQQTAARAVRRQRHPAHLLSGDVLQAVVLREAAVDEGEVGVDQVIHAAVLRDQLREEQLGLLRHRLAEPVVVLGIEPGVRAGRAQLVEPERLTGEVPHEPPRPRVVEHPVDLRPERRRRRQPARARRVEQLVVRHAAPQEVGQPRSQREVVRGTRTATVRERSLTCSEQDRDLHRMLMYAWLDQDETANRRMWEQMRESPLFEFLERYIARRQAEGVFGSGDPRLLSGAVLAVPVHHAIQTKLYGIGPDAGDDEVVELYARFLLDGLRGR